MTDVFGRERGDPIGVLDEDGRPTGDLPPPDLDDDALVAIYRDMRFARRLDERCISLQRQGRMGTYASLAGQEGAQVASTHALAADDPISYQYREHGAVVSRGFLAAYLRYWMGQEEGNAALADRDVFPLNISVGSHLPHAVGLAMGVQARGDDRVVACHFGDGATSEGDFHEAANFAGVRDAPVVFFCNNNQWAISVPRERQTASETLAEKARAYGFEGVRVDGMDPLAVYAVTERVAAKARGADGDRPRPTLVEAVQYRFGAHTTADDPSAYRDEAEVEEWRERDPIPRLEAYLRGEGVLDDDRVAAVESEVAAAVDDAVEAAEAAEPDPSAMFTAGFADPPARVREQAASLERLRERHGDEALLEDDLRD